ncbi:MAG: hypothetical protein KC502_02290 [Myxococcales bacterium]|nr:hypothetical protein [Myxococcales bacterium]
MRVVADRLVGSMDDKSFRGAVMAKLMATLCVGVLALGLGGCGKTPAAASGAAQSKLTACEATCKSPRNCYCKYKNGSMCQRDHVLLGTCTCACE